jgi:hypothetical protein
MPSLRLNVQQMRTGLDPHVGERNPWVEDTEDHMKRALVVLFSLSIVLLGSVTGASAGTSPRMWANIPFAFYAGEEMLPAGEYLFEMPDLGHHTTTGSTLAVRTRDGSICVYLQAIAGGIYRSGPAYQVTFTRYGDSYFLSKVQNNDIESNLPKTRSEKKTAAAYARLGGKESTKQVADTFFNNK